MNTQSDTARSAVLLIGSPKARSASEALGAYLIDGLQARGWTAQHFHVNPALRSEERWHALAGGVAQAGLVVLAYPLYVDSPPAGVMRLFERLAEQRRASPPGRPQRLVAIANCGFPEARHNEVSLAICRQFCREAGFEWAGGLALGQGPALGGKTLPEAGGMARGAARALDLAAAALAAGQPVPDEAVALMAKPFIPAWMYRLMGGLGWRQQAKPNGVADQLGRRPHAHASPEIEDAR